MHELGDTFDCFGSRCSALVAGDGGERSAQDAVALAKRLLLAWHGQFSRFLPDSELSRLNDEDRRAVPVSPLMARLAEAAVRAGALTDGLVDGFLIDELETVGYTREVRQPLPLELALALAPARRRARAAASPRWRQVKVDLAAGVIERPPGVKLDSGGLAKGLFADVLAELLADHASFAVNCAGDLAIGGAAGATRPIEVESPFDGSTLHVFEREHTGVATSGIGRRSWLDRDGRPAHHLLDPASGRPAFTGVVQATALAPSALLAEIYAKAALLSGPHGAREWLPHGGVIVLEDGSHRVVEEPPQVSVAQLEALAQRAVAGTGSAAVAAGPRVASPAL